MTRFDRRPRVLFRVAAGPRTGFGHLVRAVSLAEALGVRPLLSVRGSRAGVAPAGKALGAAIVDDGSPSDVLAASRPDVLVIDDRVGRRSAPWRRAARRAGVPIVSVHDLGLGLGDADLVVDGSVGAERLRVSVPALLGTRFAILGPTCAGGDGRLCGPDAPLVIALGGGPRRGIAARLARAITATRPAVRIAVAGGFVGAANDAGIDWIAPAAFPRVLASARLGVIGGGVTLYEALALGVPCVATAVVASQRPTIDGFAARGAIVDGGVVAADAASVARLAATVVRLLDDEVAQRRLGRLGPRLVDGRGGQRVAAAIRRVVAAVPRGTAAGR